MFQEDKFYSTDDPALLAIAPRATWTTWRCRGKGPPFHKYGRRILYLGKDLTEWLKRSRVDPRDRAA